MESKHAERIKSLVNSADAAGWVQLSPRDVAAIGALIHDAETAPDLLAALEAVSNANMYPGGANPFYAISEDDMDAARAAIARARGE